MHEYDVEELINEKIRFAVDYDIVASAEDVERLKYKITELTDANEELQKKIKKIEYELRLN